MPCHWRQLSARFALACVLLLCAGCGGESAPQVISGETMGTYYSVAIAAPVDDATTAHLSAMIEDVLADVNASMSTYIEDSELSRFNRLRSTGWQDASPQLVAVLLEAQRISALSNGAFDVTVGPLVNLWGFGPDGDIHEKPTVDTINRTLAKVGFQHLEVRASPPMVRKRIPELYVDLSAIAKGYAVDRIAAALAEAGVHDSLVDIGGELYASGVNADADAWRIGIEEPAAAEREAMAAVQISNAGIATSGDYRIYAEFEGRRYSHEIDPYTGWPVKHRTVLVSVIASSAMEADAWATALLVTGSEAGIELARRHDVAAYFVDRVPGGLKPLPSPGFQARSGLQPKPWRTPDG